ncbi:non-ribosomal peptide synthetase [Phormidesmis priestleyi ULC007]|uniref:Non-ribosomal peptide synthetase n=1 Tax=Phormidesmis priestleyi ULC007 TaxID=1920490 RepID=A0A2T1DB26_9CYAN|nr:non-ribosomal peptide synthetase [Phormidesmis priestleyi]PSB17676.1 non-ribosomal peptide synthetase [Phormidesmis priestleyi ULC007]
MNNQGKVQSVSTGKENLKDLYPLTPMQAGMLFHSLYDESLGTFLEQIFCSITGDFHIDLFEKSWNELFKQNDIFRTILIPQKASQPLQMVLRECQIIFHYEDIQHLTGKQQEDFLKTYQQKDRKTGFKLDRDLLMRVAVFQTHPDAYEIVWTYHHILLDGWSSGLMLGQLIDTYKALVDGKRPNPGSAPPYSDFIRWLKQQNTEAAQQYWKQYLQGYTDPVRMPRSQFAATGYQLSTFTFTLDEQSTSQLEQLARQYQVTLNSLVQSMWAVLLAHYHDADDVIFGSTISGRPPEIRGIEQMLGLFINTVPVRVRLTSQLTFAQLMEQIQNDAIASMEHSYYSLADIQALSEHRSSLIDHLIVFQNYPAHDRVREALETTHYGFTIEKVQVVEQSNYDFSVVVTPGNQLQFRFLYNANVFSPAYLQRLESHLSNIIKAVLQFPEIAIADIQLLSDRESHLLLSEFNATKTVREPEKTIVDLIEQQTNHTPDAIAVQFADKKLSYRELGITADKIAAYLMTQTQVQPGEPIAILLSPSEQFVIAVLAVIKAGCGFMALDPKAPIERNLAMISESGSKVAIVDERFSTELKNFSGTVVVIENLDLLEPLSTNHLPSPADLAYIIFTSGSTGNPKGIAVNHSSLFNYIQWCANFYFRGRNLGTMPLFTSPAFDLTITSLFCPLVLGKTVVVVDREEIDQTLRQIIDLENQIDTIKLTPAHISALKQLEAKQTAIQLAIVGGEELKKEQVETLLALNPNMEIYNEYGPAEATVGCIVDRVTEPDHITIGQPIDNTRVYILNSHLQPVPIGCVGEIYIAGSCLADGYWTNPALSAAKFIAHPLEPTSKLYRSGDLGKWLETGTMIYLGRKDDQVKIRGHRVELGEVEGLLKQHPGVEEAVVATRELPDQEQELKAYLIPDSGRAPLLRRLVRLIAEDPNLQNQLHSLPNGLQMFGMNRKEIDYLYQEIFEEENYLAHGITVSNGDIVFDVGANIGMFSLLIHQQYPEAQIYAFEPIPPVYATLSKNSILYGEKIHCYPFSLSCEETQQTFTYYPTNTVMSGRYGDTEDDRTIVSSFILNNEKVKGSNGVLSTEEELDDSMRSLSQTVHLRRLSSVLRELDISHVDLLKIDVEKSELDVLDGIDAEDWQKIKQLIVEVHDIDGRLEHVKARLARYGFQVQVAQDNLLKGTNLYKIYGHRVQSQMSNTATQSQQEKAAEQWGQVETLVKSIRAFLDDQLPQYLIPSDFQLVDQFPLTHNGKLDRKALLQQAGLTGKQNQAYELPRSRVEKVLAEIWQDLLGVKSIGVDDDFFVLGGHSLKALTLLSRIRKSLGIEIALKSVFEFSTIRTLGNYLGSYIATIGPDQNIIIGKEQMILLSTEREKPLFALPTVLGYGIAFKGLAQQLKFHSVYGLDFIEDNNPVARYIELLEKAQPEGSYVLLGYCGGGNLAFELAKGLEQRDRHVSDIIMLDSVPRFCQRNDSEAMIQEQVDAEIGYYSTFVQEDKDLNQLFNNPHFKEKLRTKMTAYLRYSNHVINNGQIAANIHLICSQENQPISNNLDSWVNITTGKVSVYEGLGNHGDMLVNEYLYHNAHVMNEILEQTLQN